MKLRSLALPLAAGLGLAGSAAHGADPVVPSNVRVDVQMVSVSVAASLQLVPAMQDAKTAQAAWVQLQEMLARGEAILLDWPVIWLQGGNVSVSENNEECRFPTEFVPPTEPQTFGWIAPPKKTLRPDWDNITPTTFETRNTGSSMEVEAAVEDEGRVLALNLRVRFLRLMGFQKWPRQPSPIGVSGVAIAPAFHSSTVMMPLHVHTGRPTFIGAFVTKKPELHVELFVLHAKAILLPPDAVTPPLPVDPENSTRASPASPNERDLPTSK